MKEPSASQKSAIPSALFFEPFETLCIDDERDLARLDPAWGKAALFFRTGHRLGHPRGSIRCMSLLDVHRLLEAYHDQFDAGNTLALLRAIGMCAEENLPLPTWLVDAFRSRMAAFGNPGKLRSLDEFFSSPSLPTKPAKKAAAARQDWQLAAKLCNDAWGLARNNEALSSFDQVVTRLLKTRDYGVGKTKAKQLIAMIETSQSQFLGKEMFLSRFLENRRKQRT